MASEAQRKAIQKYKQKVKRIQLEFSPAESDTWEHIQSQEKKQTYIKNLIRADMDKGGQHAHYETKVDVGQEFWTIDGTKHWVAEIRICEDNFIYYVYDFFYDECYDTFRDEDIGTKIFLSKEDAELALSK